MFKRLVPNTNTRSINSLHVYMIGIRARLIVKGVDKLGIVVFKASLFS